MKRTMIFAAFGAMAGVSGTGAIAGEACVEAWKSDVQQVANSQCVACHQNAAPAGELSLQRGTAPDNLIEMKSGQAEMNYVTRGEPSESYLWRKLQGTHLEAGGSGERMPLGGVLSEADLAVFENWIASCGDG